MKIKYSVFTALALLVTTVAQAHAYVDLGTGSMVVQSVMAALVGGGFFFKDTIARIFSGFQKKPNTNDKNSSDN